jgi:hypothetical protein
MVPLTDEETSDSSGDEVEFSSECIEGDTRVNLPASGENNRGSVYASARVDGVGPSFVELDAADQPGNAIVGDARDSVIERTESEKRMVGHTVDWDALIARMRKSDVSEEEIKNIVKKVLEEDFQSGEKKKMKEKEPVSQSDRIPHKQGKVKRALKATRTGLHEVRMFSSPMVVHENASNSSH